MRLLEKVAPKRAACLKLCGRYWRGWVCSICKEPEATQVVCRQRLCPKCARRRAIEAIPRYWPLFSDALCARHVVLTQPLVPPSELRQGHDAIMKACRRLRHRNPEWFQRGIYGIEETVHEHHEKCPPNCSREGWWHVHMHLLTTGAFVPKAQLDAEWQHVTGGRARFAWVEYVSRDPNQKSSAIREVVKYAAKGIDCKGHRAWTEAHLREWLEAKKGRKLVHSFGDRKCPRATRKLECPECEGELERDNLLDNDEVDDWLDRTHRSAQTWQRTAPALHLLHAIAAADKAAALESAPRAPPRPNLQLHLVVA